MTRHRLRFAGTVILILAECLFFLYLVAFGWAFRGLMLNPGDPEIAIRTRTVGVNAVWLALNVIGGAAYIYRRDGFGRNAIFVVLAIDILNALFAAAAFIAVRNDPGTAIGWILEALVPAAALVLVWQQGRKAPVSTGG
ncbi:MAG: hypothetical protein ABI334_09660 [Candidatus Dormiibacterota bacterium]